MYQPQHVYGVGESVCHFAPSSIFGSAALSLPGGNVAEFDPGTPGRLICVRVVDAEAAAPSLTALVGDANVARLLDEGLEDDDVVLAPVPPADERAQALADLAFALWWERWSPLNTLRAHHLLDIGLAAAGAGRPSLAVTAFEEAAPTVSDLSVRLLDRAVPAALQHRLREVAEVAVTQMGPKHPFAPLYAGLLDAVAESSVPDLVPDDFLAPLLGATSGVLGGGTDLAMAATDIDWHRVPPRILSVEPDAVIDVIDGSRRRVSVAAHPLLTDDGGRQVEVAISLLDPDGWPEDVIPMSYDASSRQFHAEFDASSRRDLRLDIHTVDAGGDIAIDQQEVLDRSAARAAIRALGQLRLGDAAASLGLPSLTLQQRDAILTKPLATSVLASTELSDSYAEWKRRSAKSEAPLYPPQIAELLLVSLTDR